jgi:gamma-glutamyltranspeptidase/glutathione hydrolase
MRDFELPGRSATHSTHGMAATAHPLATLSAIDVLRAGGNAMDAAIAANAVLGVVEPAMSGIGGDCVVLYAPKGGPNVHAFIGLGRTPAAARLAWYRDKGIDKAPPFSPHVVAVPALVDAWVRLLADHGTRPLAALLEPAIGYAEDGYPVHERVARDFAYWAKALAHDPNTRATFLKDGKPPRQGTLHRRPALAATLRRVAAEGWDGFYRGPVAEDIVAYLKGLGGLHTLDDFANVKGEYAAPIMCRYRGFDVVMPPPPSLGIITLMTLNVLSRFELSDMGPLSADRLHLEVEAGRLAYAERASLGPDGALSSFAIERMLSPAHGAARASLITPDGVIGNLAGPARGGPAETTYLTVVDRDRNTASFMSTLFDFFGSRLTSPKSGVLLNDRASYFTSDGADPNAWGPSKRPLAYSLPGLMMKDGRVVMSYGIVGGSFQPLGMAHLLTNVVDHGLDVQAAIALPRVFSQDGVLDVERGVPDKVALDLAARGHKVVRRSEGPRRTNGPLGGAQAIWIDWEEGMLTGGADPRKDGSALGY